MATACHAMQTESTLIRVSNMRSIIVSILYRHSMSSIIICRFLFWLYSCYLFLHPTLVSSLPSPIQCCNDGCSVSSYQRIWIDRIACRATSVAYPTTEEELVHVVANAVRNKLKIKVVSKGSHSTTKLVCPGGNDGIIISTRYYNSRIHVNETDMTVTADAGVQLRDLLDRIADAGLALLHTPYWEGVSIAGLISTGAHGSGLWGKGSATHEYVKSMRLVIPATGEQGYARVVELTEKDEEELNAARVSLGVLGAISQITFALEPMFKRSVTLQIRDDNSLGEEIGEFANSHEFGSLSWYPSLNKILLKLDDRVASTTQGDGIYKLGIVDSMPVSVIENIRAAEEAREANKDAELMCEVSKNLLNERFSSGDGLRNDGVTFQQFPVIGFNHRMQTSGGCQSAADMEHIPVLTATGVEYTSNCLESYNNHTCNWDPRIRGFFFFNTAISIPISRIQEAIRDIKRLHEADPKALCGLAAYGGIWMRFIRKSSAFLGEREDAVVFDILYYRSREANTPRLHEDLIEEIEQLLLMKYEGKPHFGKNRDLVFRDMERRTVDLPKFLVVKDRFDPEGVFSSEWSDAILGIRKNSGETKGVETLRDYCALEGLCICTQDRDCAPEMGYVCRAGRVFESARVCRYECNNNREGGGVQIRRRSEEG